MKKNVAALVVTTMILSSGPSQAAGQLNINYNKGERLVNSQEFLLENGSNFLSTRELTRALGGKIDWDPVERKVIFSKDQKQIVMDVDINVSYISTEDIYVESEIRLVNGRTYLPIRFISEVMGYDVSWDSKTRTIFINDQGLEGEDLDSYEGFEQLTAEELNLARSINEYRKSRGLSELRVSKSLTKVARVHSRDQQYNYGEIKHLGNMHSWSNKGSWRPVNYTADHKYSNLMWSKPSELTDYKGYGFEISHYNSGTATSSSALSGWKGSKGHNDVIIGAGPWRDLSVMGVSVYKNYANVWFGTEADPEGYYSLD